MNDVRWKQRFDNYEKALSSLNEAAVLAKTRDLSVLEEQGLIQSFEYTHELAWKTLKDLLKERGTFELYGSKDVTRKAFEYEIIEKGNIWMAMIKSRNLSSHTYNKDTAKEISNAILSLYIDEFNKLRDKLFILVQE